MYIAGARHWVLGSGYSSYNRVYFLLLPPLSVVTGHLYADDRRSVLYLQSCTALLSAPPLPFGQ